MTLEEAEEKMKNRKKTADGYQRWMMKAANNGPAAFGEHVKFDDKESNTGGVRIRKKTGEDDEGHVSDKGEEDEEEESERKSRLGLLRMGWDSPKVEVASMLMSCHCDTVDTLIVITPSPEL